MTYAGFCQPRRRINVNVKRTFYDKSPLPYPLPHYPLPHYPPPNHPKPFTLQPPRREGRSVTRGPFAVRFSAANLFFSAFHYYKVWAILVENSKNLWENIVFITPFATQFFLSLVCNCYYSRFTNGRLNNCGDGLSWVKGCTQLYMNSIHVHTYENFMVNLKIYTILYRVIAF